MRNCGKCHTCGTQLAKVLGGEEWCPTCGRYRRYRSHGWGQGMGFLGITGRDNSPCPEPEQETTNG